VCSPFQLFAEGGSIWEGDREKERERERNSGKVSENRSRGQKTLPPPLFASQISICGDE